MAVADPEALAVEALAMAARPASWVAAAQRLEAFARAFDFEHIVYLSLRPEATSDGRPILVSTFPVDWECRYLESDPMTTDPVVRMVRDRYLPFDWAGFGAEDAAALAPYFESDGRPHPARQGLTVPIHGPDGAAALLSATAGREAALWQIDVPTLQSQLQMFGWEFHRAIERLRELASGGGAETLPTPREIEVLRWAAAGKTARETALLLGLTAQTVEGYVRDAVRRLGCRNKTHAVAEAVRRRLI